MNISFPMRQLAFVLQSIPGRTNPIHLLRSPLDLWRTVIDLSRLKRALAEPEIRHSKTFPPCSVILLSHNRPFNMGAIVTAALKSGIVADITVSNSNKNVLIKEWISLDDPRLTLIDDRSPTRPGHRFTLANQSRSDFFLAIDDDFFLTPRQWAAFYEKLLEQPSVPHGFRGNDYLPRATSSNGSPFHHVQNVSQETDVLIGAYAFTRRHLQRMMHLAEELHIGDLSQLANGEDILLSFSGEGRPRIHDLEKIIACASESLEGIALWKTHKNFWEERIRIFESARALVQDHFPEIWSIAS